MHEHDWFIEFCFSLCFPKSFFSDNIVFLTAHVLKNSVNQIGPLPSVLRYILRKACLETFHER